MDPKASKATVHVIGASPVSLLTDDLTVTLPVVDGVVQPDVENDILRIACVERYGKNGSIGRAFIKNFGLKSGAIAISVGHDHHNVSVVGSNPDDMALAVNRIQELQGGLVFVDGGKVIEEIALPICGLLANEPGEVIAEKLRAVIAAMAQHRALSQRHSVLHHPDLHSRAGYLRPGSVRREQVPDHRPRHFGGVRRQRQWHRLI